MAKVKVTELVAPLYELTQSMKGLKLKPQPTSELRFTSFCNQQTHVGESKQSDVVYWVDDMESEDIHVRCKCCGDLTMDMIQNPATVEIKPVNESVVQVEIKPTNEPVELVNSLPIDEITIDQRLQARMEKEPDPQVVTEYAELMLDGVVFPPVVIFREGETRLLAEGFHRIAAAKQAGFTSISVTVIEGNERAAMLHSLGSNAKHGKKSNAADMRHAVEIMLKDEEWSAWSDRAIAEQCRVSHEFVRKLRSHCQPLTVSEVTASPPVKERTYTTKHGTTAKMRTGNIGKKQEPVKPTILVKQEHEVKSNLDIATTDKAMCMSKIRVELPSAPTPYAKKGTPDRALFLAIKIKQLVGEEKSAAERIKGYFELFKEEEAFKLLRDVFRQPFDSVKSWIEHTEPNGLGMSISDFETELSRSDSNDEMDKLKCELAYLKSKIRDVYFDKASIRLDGDDQIRFDELPESN
jgi:hypothetical protein